MPNFDHTPAGEHRERLLRERLVGWLATVRPDGRPHLVPVWFLWNGAEVLITSMPGAQKVVNLRANQHVSFALDDSREGHEPVLLEGIASLDATDASDPDVQAYVAKYRASYAEMDWDEAAAMAEFTVAIRIRDIRFITF